MATPPRPTRRVPFVPRTESVPDDYDTGACRCATITTLRGTAAEHRRQQCTDIRADQTAGSTS
jgi:hypothetical protein